MQYTKPMIELVYEIRRRVPSDLKPSVKLANPDLFNELNIYYKSEYAATVPKALIRELFKLAGEQWEARLADEQFETQDSVSKLYRGVLSLEDKPSMHKDQKRSEQQKKRIYRGQVIA